MDYSCAGHNIPYILRSDNSVEPVDITPGYPLGISKNFTYPSGKISLKPGDKLFLYTDGIPEAMNEKEEMFDDDRLIDTLKKLTTDD